MKMRYSLSPWGFHSYGDVELEGGLSKKKKKKKKSQKIARRINRKK